jgi:hypothetical protein
MRERAGLGKPLTRVQVEWENSTSFDTVLPDDAPFTISEVPLERLRGDYGDYGDYCAEEPEHMADLEREFLAGRLPLPAFVLTPDGFYDHLDGAHRVLIARHLARTSLVAYVHVLETT